MFHQLKVVINNKKNLIRILSYSLISVTLLLMTWFFDYGFPQWKQSLPSVLLLSTEVSTSLLSNLSGVFLTVTTFTFTTILTILHNYSSSFTPRIVQDFIDKPNVLSLFGILIGGFFYTVLALFFLQNVSSDVMVISGTIAVFYAVASMIAFVLFVLRVLKEIKTDTVIDTVFLKASQLVAIEAQKRQRAERYADDTLNEGISIYGQSTGYFYDIDYNGLMSCLRDVKAELIIYKKIGEYIPKGMYMANLRLSHDSQVEAESKGKLLENIANSFIMNTTKNDQEDYHFEITNLIEIALKALSPGINDPNTAIICINKLAILLGKLFSSKNYFTVVSNEHVKIVYTSYSVEEELYLTFNQILFYAKAEPAVARAVLESVYLIYMMSDPSARDEVQVFFGYVYDVCEKALNNRLDKQYLQRIKHDFEANRHERSNEDVLRDGQ